MKPRDTKIEAAKILTVEILTSNFEQAIEHVGRRESDGVFSSLQTALQTPVDPSTPVSLLR